ncbi:UvrD-helicase domain-containing protein [Paenibacillus sepulcri]|uniref:DNA 3'-5' helicase n=1 Tax=Paenibacillus sepulcri TaxID=359917 RepID=A0ABS7BYL1_9BACL|nr:ATP-dependent helicase [Paenibacillus sepulcri]
MDTEKLWFLDDLNPKQRAICISDKNTLLTACPGSGKTRTLTYRLAFLSTTHSDSHKLNIAITYTNRASEEIKSRLINFNIDLKNIWAGTIHQFCLEFIIRPYSMFSKRISKGYHIIDEFVQRQYTNEICEQLQIKLNFNEDPFLHPTVVQEYNKRLEENKEIDFNMILKLSYDLVNSNNFIRYNLSSILRSVHVDEYQDTNDLQYNILGLIARENRAIRFYFIGDINQAIYGGIGGIAKNKTQLDELFGTSFEIEQLDGCYRSTQRAIDFYSHFQVASSDISAESNLKDEMGIISYDRTIDRDDLAKRIAEIINEQLELGVPEKEICVIAPQWGLLYPISKSLRSLLPNVSFDAPDVTPIKFDPMNVFYRISQLKFSVAGKNTGMRKRVANEIISILTDDYKIHLSDNIDSYFILKCINAAKVCDENGIETLINTVNSLFSICKIDLEQEMHLKKAYIDFFDKVNQRITDNNLTTDMDAFKKCFQEKSGVVINSYHGVKGEEYTTVIAFGFLNGLIPNWDLIINFPEERTSETRKLLYVICSRAKQNLYLFSEQGRVTRKGNPLNPTDELISCCAKFNLD